MSPDLITSKFNCSESFSDPSKNTTLWHKRQNSGLEIPRDLDTHLYIVPARSCVRKEIKVQANPGEPKFTASFRWEKKWCRWRKQGLKWTPRQEEPNQDCKWRAQDHPRAGRAAGQGKRSEQAGEDTLTNTTRPGPSKGSLGEEKCAPCLGTWGVLGPCYSTLLAFGQELLTAMHARELTEFLVSDHAFEIYFLQLSLS